jgi:hypothetical protein
MQKAIWKAPWCVLVSAACLLLPAASRLLAQAPPPLKEFSHAKHLTLGNVAPLIAGAIDTGTYLGKDGGKIRPFLNSGNPCQACHYAANGGLPGVP